MRMQVKFRTNYLDKSRQTQESTFSASLGFHMQRLQSAQEDFRRLNLCTAGMEILMPQG